MQNRTKLANLIFKNLEAPGKRFEIENKGDETTVYLYDVIDNWYGVDSQSFIKELHNIKSTTINLRINSPGGDVFDARAMVTALKQHSAKIVAHIDGLAASAATYVALAADEVRMSEGAFFMIHKGWTISMGNADEFRKTAELLDKVDQSIVSDYHAKSGIDKDELIDLMAAETWFTAEEAKERGFIDEVVDGESVANSFDLTVYDHAPQKIAAKAPEMEPKPVFNARTTLYQKLTQIHERANA